MTLDKVRKLSPMDRLIYWITERESIRLKKEAGEPPPWTDDPILQKYRFCNVRRMDDKVSRWLLKNWYEPNKDHPNILVAVALARFFNLPRTLEQIGVWTFGYGPPRWAIMKESLRGMSKRGPIFNGAYMVRGNDGQDKVASVIDYYVGALVKAKINVDTSSMQNTHARIAEVYGFGSFMAGQIVADLRWAMTGEWKDRVNWAPIGPGSLRGLHRLGSNDLLTTIDCLKLSVSNDRLEAMDYQNCLCEFDKYERALGGTGKPKQLYKVVSS